MGLTAILTLGCLVAATAADKQTDEELQKVFRELEGAGKQLADNCFNQTSSKLTDLKYYTKGENIPEKELCFMKCFYEGIMVVTEDGRINVDLLRESPMFSHLEESKFKQLQECLKNMDNIKTCQDMMKLDECIEYFH